MINLGVVGFGRIGKVHAESLTKYVSNVSLKAVADPFMNEEGINCAKSMGVKNVYKDYKEILNDPEIDAVLVCSSTDTHSKISIEALKSGKHVFCEKPIDHDIERIKEVLKEVEKSNLKFQVGFNRRFDHNFKTIKNTVEAGKIGEPHIIKITSRDPEAPPIEYVKVSGGIFLDMSIHDFDMIRYLSGSEVEEVYAIGDALINPDIKKEGDVDTAIITLKLANGALGVIDNSREASYGYDQRAEVFGSKGSVQISNDANSTAVVSTKDGITGEKPLYFFLERYMQSFADEIKEFVKAIEEDKEVPVTAIDGLNAVLIGIAATKSLKEGKAVKISEIGL
ncbi:inositol 2-dehydrogenase [Clostridium tetani]|uniref:Inositol 2-dehydrogenase n=1 Tax=Clostridium tetani TaxID=1513 RepID=A0ABY0EQY1_CLOTA|nr:inositol 2-dehydrogenase [Clostridium tetani]KHO40088.1 oxidoreductase [Clostridium tetani]RXI57541.1 inositol 2-dehydrogenase [Clostridium tetani]RXI72260.1 inositol 2-dehydrogenase [Clostridium tetani]CDI48570.1 myo-inositol 2-dehydrogenase [Clostridium tetani 12124569]